MSVKSIVVLAGGCSGEQAVSLCSAQAVAKACQSLGYDIHLLEIQSAQDLSQLLALRPDCVLNMVHGIGGEDGQFSAFMDLYQIPYVGSDLLSSALAMDKYRSKVLFREAGISVLPGQLIQASSQLKVLVNWDYPLCFKPYNQGSSLGVTQVANWEGCVAAYEAIRHYGPVLVEPWISGKEYAVGWVGDCCLPIVEIETPAGSFYDYQAKYHSQHTQYRINGELSKVQQDFLHETAQKAVTVLGCQDWGRVDFIADNTGKFHLMEINTIPGMSETSLLPKAAAALGWSFEQLVAQLIKTLENVPVFDLVE